MPAHPSYVGVSPRRGTGWLVHSRCMTKADEFPGLGPDGRVLACLGESPGISPTRRGPALDFTAPALPSGICFSPGSWGSGWGGGR